MSKPTTSKSLREATRNWPAHASRPSRSRHKRRLILSATVLFGLSSATLPCLTQPATAADCTDINIIFARGSGEQLNDVNYQAFKSELEPYLTGMNYRFYELGSNSYGGYHYNAVAVGFNTAEQLLTTIGAKIGAGNSYKFGASVNQGVGELKSYITQVTASCPNARFALAGYSQGAMVVSKALRSLDSSRIVSIATIADPKLYLPEGAGTSPKACSDPSSLSDYRAYVPDCYAYEGIFNGYQPYLPDSSYSGKVATYCNYHDLICSSRINWEDLMSPHTNYVSDGRYQDVAELMASQIYATIDQIFVSKNSSSTHDLAILIDSTGSMSSVIDRYKQETLALATNILAKGGRIALYEYRDLRDPFIPILHCGFDECNIDILTRKLDKIQADGGGDYEESLLSASLTALNTLKWKKGANKTILAITDAGFHSPDHDGATLSQVIARCLEIDPVHIYVLTPVDFNEQLKQLATETGGEISLTHSELSFAIENADPEGAVFDDGRSPQTVSITNLQSTEIDGKLKLTFDTDAYRTLVILNDSILGFTDQTELLIEEIDSSVSNDITLVPFSESGSRGDSATLNLAARASSSQPVSGQTIIGAPSSGFAKKS